LDKIAPWIPGSGVHRPVPGADGGVVVAGVGADRAPGAQDRILADNGHGYRVQEHGTVLTDPVMVVPAVFQTAPGRIQAVAVLALA